MRSSRLALILLVLVASLAGCGGRGFTGRGRSLVAGRPVYDHVDPSGVWQVDGALPWGSGHTLEISGPGPVFHVVRRDGGGQIVAFGVALAEAGHLFVAYSANQLNTQVAVYAPATSTVEGVWAHGQAGDLGTEEWDGTGFGDPFVGTFETYGTNPDNHRAYRLGVRVDPMGGYYDVIWGSGTQEFVGTGIIVAGRLVVASILERQLEADVEYFDPSGYGVAAYNLTTGEGTAMLRPTSSAPVTGGNESLFRPGAVATAGGESPITAVAP